MSHAHKPWWQSKTLWLNVIAELFLLATSNIDALQGVLPDALQKTLVFALPMLNLLFRVFTTRGIAFRKCTMQEQK